MASTYQVVARVEPIKNTLALMGVAKHEKRIGAAKKDSHDPARTHLNAVLYGSDDLFNDTLTVAGQYKKAHEKSAIAAEMILTANAEWFDKISPKWREGVYTKELIQWRDLTMKWLKESYPGLSHASLHMDEAAPHIHAVVVPIATKTIHFRRGEKEVTRIRYNDVFGDDMQTIVAARKAGDSEMTKLGRLQTAYATAMKPTGLKRGISSKKVYHQTIKEYQDHLATPAVTLHRMEKAPEPTLQDQAAAKLGIQTETLRKIAEVNASNAKNSRQNKQIIKELEAKAKDYDRIKKEVEALKENLIMKDEKLAAQGEKLRELDDYKAVVARLRGIDLQDVAQRIGATPTKADRNAIDLLKNHASMSYNEAVAWLYNEYDEKTAVYEAARNALHDAARITAVKPEQPLSPLDAKTAAQVDRQLSALAASRYRITLQVADEKATPALHTYNYGKAKGEDKTEQFYTQKDITRVIPFLRRENTRGYNVFVTPFDDEKLYLLVDDLNDESLKRFDAAGYKPNVLQTTSRESMQAVFVLPKQEVVEPARNALFNELNAEYGDKNITGYTHPFRLAGFTNAKPKHLDEKGHRPFVRVLQTAAQACGKAIEWCRAFMRATTMPKPTPKQREADERALHTTIIANAANDGVAPSAEASRVATQFYAWIATRYGLEADYSRADHMLAERMTGRFTPDDIARALLAHSPGIEDRHRDVMRYVHSTVSSGIRPQ